MTRNLFSLRLDGPLSVHGIILDDENPRPTAPDSSPNWGLTCNVLSFRNFGLSLARLSAVGRCRPQISTSQSRGYASKRSGFSSFQTSIFSPLAIFSILSIETFRSHRSTELT
jgi:hypothetical protein